VNSTVTRALKHLTSSDETPMPPACREPDTTPRASLADAIAGLPARERLALALCYEEKLSCEEMGSVLGMTTDEAELLHTQALANLASRIAVNK
jgi:DNA-directed RNA polymerase specialized sigma24 family protein